MHFKQICDIINNIKILERQDGKMTHEEKMEEDQKFFRNMHELAEKDCARKRSNGFPCSKESCEKYGESRCLHPEKAGFPAKRY